MHAPNDAESFHNYDEQFYSPSSNLHNVIRVLRMKAKHVSRLSIWNNANIHEFTATEIHFRMSREDYECPPSFS